MIKVIDIIKNKEGSYKGDLAHYFRVLWHSPNILHPYHNLRHMLHVTWATYQGAMYYKDQLSDEQIRALLIAAMFHDYNHTGTTGNDSVNIQMAINGMRTHALPMDRNLIEESCKYIRATQFPHLNENFDLPSLILRDVDVAYTLSDVWIQLVNFGLNQELGMSPEQMLKGQESFLSNMKFHTEWGEKTYRPKIQPRIDEVKEMIEVLFGR